MKYTMNFGKLAAQPVSVKTTGEGFRIAVLGDFSGRANAGKIETGATLASRKPFRIDVDNLESVLARIAPRLRLPIAAHGGSIDVAISSMDDFHPDQLYQNLEIFSELAELRKRLKNTSTFAEAAKAMQSWSKVSAASGTDARQIKPRGAAIPYGKLEDFARLLGRSTTAERTTPINELLKRIVAPHVVPAPNPEQKTLIAAVDEALATSMRQVLHNPDFQSLESIWRSVELIVRNLETDATLQIFLYDLTAEELAADLSSADVLEDTGLYRLLFERPVAEGQQDPFSIFLGNYMFESIPPHVELLGRIAKIAAAAQAPFIAGISADCLRRSKQEEVHPLLEESWNTLRSMPHAQYVGLTVPRFMLRWPYGAKSEPINSFTFEEFTPQSGLKGFLWASGSILVGLLLGRTFSEQGLAGMKLDSNTVLGDVPFYYYTDENDDQIALPCTERWVSEPVAFYALSQNLMPVLSVRGRPEIRLGSFGSLHGCSLAGPWAPIVVERDEKSLIAEPLEQEIVAPTFQADESPVERQSSETQQPSSQTSDDELDSLLASLAPQESDQTSESAVIDPELAALLAEL